MTEWREELGIVRARARVDHDVYRLVVSAPQIAKQAEPGQFVMVLGWDIEPLLPRAMAPICFDAETGIIDMYYRVVGPGTKALTRLHVDDQITIVGPLGTPFTHYGQAIALIGRGVGITPLLPIAQKAFARGAAIRSYLSARTRRLVLGESQFAALGPLFIQDHESPPDALITDLLKDHLSSGFQPDTIMVAGSHRLVMAAVDLGAQYGVDQVWVFVEEKMACGVGYCKGCAVGPHRALICMAGPALLAREVIEQ